MNDEWPGVRFVESTADALHLDRPRGASPTEHESGAPAALVVHFTQSWNDREEFFRWVAERFSLPFYFGHNWDALEECWRDLGCFLSVDRVIVVFDSLPLAALPEEQRVLFDILRSLVDNVGSMNKPTWQLIVASSLRAAFEFAWRRSGESEGDNSPDAAAP